MKLAIDVALLPPAPMQAIAVNLSRSLPAANQKIVLDEETCVPHISLFMGVMPKETLSCAHDELTKLRTIFSPMSTAFTGAYDEPIPTGENVAGLHVRKTFLLQALHEAVVKQFTPLCQGPAELSMLYPTPPPEPVTLQWINGFATNSCFEKFWPHVTLGMGSLHNIPPFPVDFVAAEIALFQLGNYCTCRKKLTSVTLTG